MTNEHSRNCILRHPCTLADSPVCNPLCPSFIGMHGRNGRGGRIANANVPREYTSVTLQTAVFRDEQPEAYRRLTDIARSFTRQFSDVTAQLESEGKTAEQIRIKSVYLYSAETGTGKTTAAAALLNEWIVAHFVGCRTRKLAPSERPAYFLDVNEWQTLYNTFNRRGVPQDMAEKAAAEFYRQMEYARLAPYAVLDDIGVRDATEGFRGDLHTVINYRAANGLPTVYTSNIPLETMEDVFDRRLYDRMRDMCVVIPFEGKSKRGQRGRR